MFANKIMFAHWWNFYIPFIISCINNNSYTFTWDSRLRGNDSGVSCTLPATGIWITCEIVVGDDFYQIFYDFCTPVQGFG